MGLCKTGQFIPTHMNENIFCGMVSSVKWTTLGQILNFKKIDIGEL